MRAGGGKPTSVSAGVPGGCPDTRGDRGANLTLEVGVQLYGLARARVLTDNLLEANLGDLDQVPRGEAALIPADLVDGTCGDTDSVSPFGRAKHWAACALFSHKPCPVTPLHTCSCCQNALPCLSLLSGHWLSRLQAAQRLPSPSLDAPPVVHPLASSHPRGFPRSRRAQHPPGRLLILQRNCLSRKYRRTWRAAGRVGPSAGFWAEKAGSGTWAVSVEVSLSHGVPRLCVLLATDSKVQRGQL